MSLEMCDKRTIARFRVIWGSIGTGLMIQQTSPAKIKSSGDVPRVSAPPLLCESPPDALQ
jgi:hypothetical protein